MPTITPKYQFAFWTVDTNLLKYIFYLIKNIHSFRKLRAVQKWRHINFEIFDPPLSHYKMNILVWKLSLVTSRIYGKVFLTWITLCLMISVKDSLLRDRGGRGSTSFMDAPLGFIHSFTKVSTPYPLVAWHQYWIIP